MLRWLVLEEISQKFAKLIALNEKSFWVSGKAKRRKERARRTMQNFINAFQADRGGVQAEPLAPSPGAAQDDAAESDNEVVPLIPRPAQVEMAAPALPEQKLDQDHVMPPVQAAGPAAAEPHLVAPEAGNEFATNLVQTQKYQRLFGKVTDAWSRLAKYYDQTSLSAAKVKIYAASVCQFQKEEERLNIQLAPARQLTIELERARLSIQNLEQQKLRLDARLTAKEEQYRELEQKADEERRELAEARVLNTQSRDTIQRNAKLAHELADTRIQFDRLLTTAVVLGESLTPLLDLLQNYLTSLSQTDKDKVSRILTGWQSRLFQTLRPFEQHLDETKATPRPG